MDPDELRQRNKQKAEEEAGRGAIRPEPDSVPIGEAIEAFHARGDLVFGIPGHLAGRGPVAARTSTSRCSPRSRPARRS
jgi:arginine decarboxylase